MSTLCGILDSRNDKEGKLMDKCEEMRAQFDRFCDGQLTDSGTTQIQAIGSLQMKNIRKYFVPGIYSFDIVGFLDTTLL